MAEKTSRVEKLYASLDALVDELKNLLLAEFELEGESRFLHRYRDDEHVVGRFHVIQGYSDDLKHANELLDLDKKIRQLCEKLREPLPLPLCSMNTPRGIDD